MAAGRPGEHSSLFKQVARLHSMLERAGRGGYNAPGQPAAEIAVALPEEPQRSRTGNRPTELVPTVIIVSEAVLTMDDASLAQEVRLALPDRAWVRQEAREAAHADEAREIVAPGRKVHDRDDQPSARTSEQNSD